MSFLNKNYNLAPDQFGLTVITETGRCTADEKSAIESNVTRRHEMVPIPNASGAIMKSLDGGTPLIVSVTPATMTNKEYRCVKIEGVCNPMAPVQTGGTHSGSAICRYRKVFQEVGGLS